MVKANLSPYKGCSRNCQVIRQWRMMLPKSQRDDLSRDEIKQLKGLVKEFEL